MITKLKLVLSLFAMVVSLSINATIGSGKCGDNATWRLEDDGTLYIEGSGEMKDYTASSADVPWYSNRSKLKIAQISEGIVNIGDRAFSYCSSLNYVTIPNSVTRIGSAAFASCSALTSINIPNLVTSIGNDAFSGCSALTSINIPNLVNSIGEHAFWKCSALTSINIPNLVTSIGSYTFDGCLNLTSVNFEGTRAEWDAIKIGYNNATLEKATINCASGIASGTCGKNLTWTLSNDGIFTISGTGDMENYAGSAPWNKYSAQITSIEISDGVTSIGNIAFSGCSKLTSINIPNSVNSIGSFTFRKCM